MPTSRLENYRFLCYFTKWILFIKTLLNIVMWALLTQAKLAYTYLALAKYIIYEKIEKINLTSPY